MKNKITRIFFIAVLSVISASNMIAYAQLSVQGKNANGEEYQYFYWYYSSYSILDSVQLRVDYISDFAVDTIQGTRVKEVSLLDVGKTTSKFFHRQKFIADSLRKTGATLNRQTDHLFENVAYPLTFFETIYKNYPDGKITCTGRVMTQDFRYEEDMPIFDWSISDSTRIILGFTCFKATCSFRGRDYTAWFSPEIPAMTGPWKFSGLPGLILEAYDSHKEYIFTAERIYRTYDSIDFPDMEYVKTTRDKYTQAKKIFNTNIRQAGRLFMANTGWQIVDDGKPDAVSEMKYSFIEKD